jgi:hypothetical protein
MIRHFQLSEKTTKKELVEQLAGLPDETLMMAFDPDSGKVESVTSFIFKPGNPPVVEFFTDEL